MALLWISKTATLRTHAVHLHSGSICFLLHQNRKMFNRKTKWCRLPNIDHFVTSGFSEGFVKWDDDDTDNGNAHGGVVPDGEYGADTKLFYCCRYVLQFYTNINQIAANVLGITLDNVILSFLSSFQKRRRRLQPNGATNWQALLFISIQRWLPSRARNDKHCRANSIWWRGFKRSHPCRYRKCAPQHGFL